jgi:hypothetical protein
MKIYVAALEALRKKERQDETQFTTKIDGFLSLSPVYDETQGSGAVFCLTLQTTLLHEIYYEVCLLMYSSTPLFITKSKSLCC